MRGTGHEDVLVVLQVPGNKAGVVPCERLQITSYIEAEVVKIMISSVEMFIVQKLK